MRIEDFTARLVKDGSNYRCPNPSHGDRHGSLSVNRGEDGQILVNCFAGCPTEDVVASMGLNMSDLFPDTHRTPAQEIRYEYHDDDGNVIFTKIRRPDKTFYISPKGATAQLYNNAIISRYDKVYVVEGEKDVETLRGHRAATTAPYGAESAWKQQYIDNLTGKDVVIIPDNDEPGRKYAENCANAIQGKAKSVKVIDLTKGYPGLPKKGDISDLVKLVGMDKALAILDKLESETAIRDCTAVYSPKSPEYKQKRRDSAVQNIKSQGVLEINPLDDEKRYTFDDRGNGYLFADVYQNISRYCPEAREWYFYNGKIWKKDTGGVAARENAKKLSLYLFNLISGIEDDTKRERFKANAMALSRLRARESMLKDAQTVYPLSVSSLDKDPNLFNCTNGTLRLDTLELARHNSNDNLSQLAGVDYKPDARCERWLNFIREITEGDEGKARFLQKAIGYCLMGEPIEECLFILYGGTTRNGKGTFMTVVVRIFGDYAKTAAPETLAARDKPSGSAPSEDLARLRGSRLISVNEPGKNMRFDEGRLKTLTGRDVITSRFLHEGSFEYIPQFAIVINSNYKPSVNDDTVFSSGRIKLVPFNKHFAPNEQDKHLKRKLTTPDALSGIFNWMLEGLAMYRKEGLESPESVAEATEEYRFESDKIAQFMEACTVPNAMGAIPMGTLHHCYQDWCRNSGVLSESQTKLTQELKRRQYEVDRRSWLGSKFGTHVFGISLVPQGFEGSHTKELHT